jgi:hypothetical protein
MSYRPVQRRASQSRSPRQTYQPESPSLRSNGGHLTPTPSISTSSHLSRGLSQTSSRSSPPLGSPKPPVERCDVCQRSGVKTWTCIQCNNDNFCLDCWSRERAHRPGAVGFDGKPHEKTDREVVERLRQILEPRLTEQQQQELHRSDEDTTWFGIARDPVSGLPIFQDYERYATIMEQSRSVEGTVRYPQLVSFIGQTGRCFMLIWDWQWS